MGLEIAYDSNKNRVPIRCLIVNDTEKYRAVVGNRLIYAKGKINFDWNFPKDGSGEIVSPFITNHIPKTVWGFYEDGFYIKNKNKNEYSQWLKTGQSLKTKTEEVWINKGYYISSRENYSLPYYLTFYGWATDKTNNRTKVVDSIEEIGRKTNLFKYSEDESLPEITLYGCWKVATYNLRIHNIRGLYGSKSFFTYYDEKDKKNKKTDSNITFRDILYGTDIFSYINKIIKVAPQYSALPDMDKTILFSEKSDRQTLNKYPQKFLGWSWKSAVVPLSTQQTHHFYIPYHIDSSVTSWEQVVFGFKQYYKEHFTKKEEFLNKNSNIKMTWNIDIYPHFETLVIYSKTELPNGKIYKGKMVHVKDEEKYTGLQIDDSDLGMYPPWKVPLINNISGQRWWEYTKTEKLSTGSKKITKKYYRWHVRQYNRKNDVTEYGFSEDVLAFSQIIIMKLVLEDTEISYE